MIVWSVGSHISVVIGMAGQVILCGRAADERFITPPAIDCRTRRPAGRGTKADFAALLYAGRAGQHHHSHFGGRGRYRTADRWCVKLPCSVSNVSASVGDVGMSRS